jgi:preprotein translocase subunit SecF
MTTTTLSAAGAMLLVSWFGSVQILTDIAAVLLIGLVFDVMNTWLTNVGILKWYVLKGGGK